MVRARLFEINFRSHVPLSPCRTLGRTCACGSLRHVAGFHRAVVLFRPHCHLRFKLAETGKSGRIGRGVYRQGALTTSGLRPITHAFRRFPPSGDIVCPRFGQGFLRRTGSDPLVSPTRGWMERGTAGWQWPAGSGCCGFVMRASCM